MKCPNCGHRLHMMELAWQEKLFWSCLITVAINQTTQFYQLIFDWWHFGLASCVELIKNL